MGDDKTNNDEKAIEIEDRKLPENVPELRWLQLPAIYCDTFTVDTWEREGIVRISLGESMSPDVVPIFRTSVAIPLQVAKDLVQYLTDSFKEAEERQKKKDETKKDSKE